MKLSDHGKVGTLRAKLERARAVESGLTSRPPYDPILHVNGETMLVPNLVALKLAYDAVESILNELRALGVEVDE